MIFSISLVFALIFFSVTFPLFTGYLGAANGRSFWRWYAVGWALPFVSLFVVMAVAYVDQRREERAQKAALAEPPPAPPLAPGA